jgi:flagellar hook-length control protein FliK
VDEPGNSSRTKNSQEGSAAQSGSSGDAPPVVTPDLLAQGTAQTTDKEAATAVHDAKQAGASDDKKGGDSTPVSAKTADENHSLSKTTADSTVTTQFNPPARAEADRASPEAAGASQGRGESESASALAGYQSTVHGAVSSARLTQQAGNAEMQVRLRSEALGPIDVHTSVKDSDIGASIRVEARETQVMLASELSQLERALNDKSLRVQRLDVLQGSVSGGQSNGTGPDNSHGSPSQPRPGLASHPAGQAFPGLPEAPTLYEDGGLELSTARINLRV